jgi:hypothetical protein
MIGALSSLLTPETSGPPNWWPADLGVPSSLGAQNNVRYAYFPGKRRLAVDLKVTEYNTQDHQIGGFSQQQPGLGSLSFASQLGPVEVGRLPVVSARRTGLRPNQFRSPPQSQMPKPATLDFGSRTFSLGSSAWAN